jgi:glycosyltransferase involved in cell wall biosynthesis
VLAFDRIEFVGEALESVVRDRAAGPSAEILVITNFRNEVLDEAVRRVGARRVTLEEAEQGRWVARALDCSSADVFAFVDDDDRFAEGKLRRLEALFGGSPSLGYYHNRLRPFRHYASGEAAISGPDRHVPRGPERGWLRDGEKNARTLSELFFGGGAFNLSSVAVRRSLLHSHRKSLERIRGGVATFLFCAGVLSTYDLFFDALSLTDFRLHGQNTSGLGAADSAERWTRRLQLAPVAISDAKEIETLFGSAGRQHILCRIVRAIRARNQVLRMACTRASRRELAGTMLEYFRSASPRQAQRDWAYLVFGVARMISGRALLELMRFVGIRDDRA